MPEPQPQPQPQPLDNIEQAVADAFRATPPLNADDLARLAVSVLRKVANTRYTVDVPLPHDSTIITETLIVIGYLDAHGTRRTGVITRGESPMTTYLGLTVVAQDKIRQWGDRDA